MCALTDTINRPTENSFHHLIKSFQENELRVQNFYLLIQPDVS